MKNKGFNTCLLILFLLFLGLYFSSNSGLIDYPAKHRTTLTNENIKQFEEDIKNNEKIDLKKYTYYKDDKYDNTISKTTLKVSNFIGNTIKSTLDFMFSRMEDAWN